MRSLRLAMIVYVVPADDTAALAAALEIDSLEDIASVPFQRVLARVPRARGDLRYAFIDLHNAHVPGEPWDVVRDCQTSDDWHLFETIFIAQLLQIWPELD